MNALEKLKEMRATFALVLRMEVTVSGIEIMVAAVESVGWKANCKKQRGCNIIQVFVHQLDLCQSREPIQSRLV